MPAGTRNPKLSEIIQILAPQSKLIQSWPLKGGISAEMTGLAFQHVDGQIQKIIVRQPGEQSLKQNVHAAETEFKLLQMTRSLGLATPAPLFLDRSGKIFPNPYLVIEYIEGKPEFAPADPIRYTRQMAAHLARIHSAPCSAQDCAFLPKTPNDLASSMEKGPVNNGLLSEAERIWDTLTYAWPMQRRNAPTLLHGDYWPGNILWQEGQLVAVIDWEDAQWGDPLLDFAISRLDILWIFGMDALNSFTQHYQSLLAIDTTSLPFWDLYAALRLARLAGANLGEWAAFFQPFGRSDITEETIRAHYRFFINQAFETLAQRKT